MFYIYTILCTCTGFKGGWVDFIDVCKNFCRGGKPKEGRPQKKYQKGPHMEKPPPPPIRRKTKQKGPHMEKNSKKALHILKNIFFFSRGAMPPSVTPSPAGAHDG